MTGGRVSGMAVVDHNAAWPLDEKITLKTHSDLQIKGSLLDKAKINNTSKCSKMAEPILYDIPGFDWSGCPGGIHALKCVRPTQDWLSFIIWDCPKTDQKKFS